MNLIFFYFKKQMKSRHYISVRQYNGKDINFVGITHVKNVLDLPKTYGEKKNCERNILISKKLLISGVIIQT